MNQIKTEPLNYSKKHIATVLREAKKYKGLTGVNPVTACLIEKNGHIVALGFHQGEGSPHAEVDALLKAGKLAVGATLYVNLEPCTHFGKTPPCTASIIRAGIKKVVYAVNDPNPCVVASPARPILEKAGIEVVGPVSTLEGCLVNDVFFKNMSCHKPFVILKAGMSLDARIALGNKVSQFITGEKARREDHKIRREVGAILVGKGTVHDDDPMLNVRYGLLKKGYKNPDLIILDTNATLPETIRLISDTSRNIYFVGDVCPRFIAIYPHLHFFKISRHRVDFWETLLAKLYDIGIKSILIEGGAGIYTSALEANIVDKCIFYIAPKLFGGKNDVHVFSASDKVSLDDIYQLNHLKVRFCKPDIEVSGYFSNFETGEKSGT